MNIWMENFLNMKCPYCNKEARWCENKAIYGRNYGKSYMCYYCKDCDAYVGCHQNTKTPLGTMANAELRKWRKKVHAVIDPLWQSRTMTRKEVYTMLFRRFGEEVHVGQSDIVRCREIINFIENEKNISHTENIN